MRTPGLLFAVSIAAGVLVAAGCDLFAPAQESREIEASWVGDESNPMHPEWERSRTAPGSGAIDRLRAQNPGYRVALDPSGSMMPWGEREALLDRPDRLPPTPYVAPLPTPEPSRQWLKTQTQQGTSTLLLAVVTPRPGEAQEEDRAGFPRSNYKASRYGAYASSSAAVVNPALPQGRPMMPPGLVNPAQQPPGAIVVATPPPPGTTPFVGVPRMRPGAGLVTPVPPVGAETSYGSRMRMPAR